MAGSLNERERQVLEAVIETYVATAEPAGSRTISKKFGHTLSAATIRNTMSDLEEKGYLYHPHTSAGRIPTDLAYRVYVNSLMRLSQVSASDSHQIREELAERNAVDQILERAAQVLGVLTKELGVAVGPTLDEALLERLELLQAGSDRLLLVLTLKSGVVRTIFVEVPAHMAPEIVVQVAVVLNERLAGLTLREIRATLSERLRGLLEVTERRDVLREALAKRLGQGLTITIGTEHQDATLAPFTLVTASYRLGPLAGVIGVMGPTRMPYDKIVALVDHTSRLVGELLE